MRIKNRERSPSIKWSATRVCIESTQLRYTKSQSWQDEGEEEEGRPYLCIKISINDRMDESTFGKIKANKRRKSITALCFEESLFGLLKEDEVVSLSGKVSFGYGSTYLVVRQVVDV